MTSDQWTELEKLAKAATSLQATKQTTCPECGFAWYGYRHRYGCNTDAAARDYRIEMAEDPQTVLQLIALSRSEAVLREAMRRWKKANAHTHNEVVRARRELFPDVETCDCEAPCTCKYPKQWLDLHELEYHLMGADLGSDEALAESNRLRAATNSGEEGK